MKVHIEIGCAYWGFSSKVGDSAWQSFLVEAIPEYCEKLKQKFADSDNVEVVNLAISTESKQGVKFYKYNADKALKLGVVAPFLNGTCGFDPIRESDPRVCDPKIQKLGLSLYDEMDYRVVSFADFLDLKKIRAIDSLKIDTEGHDLEILEQVNFLELGITELQFEYFLVQNREEQRFANMMTKLANLGFQVIRKGGQDIYLQRKND